MLTRRILRLAPVLLAAFVISAVVAACGEGDSRDGVAGAGDVARGEELYAANCASCHGVDLQGTDEGPSHLDRVYEPSHHGDAAFENAIRNGTPSHHYNFGDMPPVPGLSADDVADIVAYVRSEQAERGFND